MAAGTPAAEKAQAPGTQQEAVGSPSPAPKPAATPHPGGATESAKKQVAPASPAAAGPPPTAPREQKSRAPNNTDDTAYQCCVVLKLRMAGKARKCRSLLFRKIQLVACYCLDS